MNTLTKPLPHDRHAFEATWSGVCVSCWDDYEPGNLVRMWTWGKVLHIYCERKKVQR